MITKEAELAALDGKKIALINSIMSDYWTVIIRDNQILSYLAHISRGAKNGEKQILQFLPPKQFIEETNWVIIEE